MRLIKLFITDFAHQPRHVFFRKYFLLPVTLFLGWVTIGTAYEQLYDLNDLDRITGRVALVEEVTTKVIDKPAYKKEEKELRLYLESHSVYFRLTDSFNYTPVIDRLKDGEVVQIYVRKPYLAYLGMGKRSDIYQLEYQGETLLHLSDKKQNVTGAIVIGAIFTIAFSAFYLYHRRKEKRNMPKVAR